MRATTRSFRLLVAVGTAVGSLAMSSLPVEAQQSPETAALLKGCGRIVRFHDRLTTRPTKKHPAKPTQAKFEADAKTLKAIALVLQDVPGAKKYATGLRGAKAGTPRRKAINKTYHWCNAQHAFDTTDLTLAPRFDVADVDPVITGTVAPGTVVVASVGSPATAASYQAIADATGAFAIAIPNLPLDTDVRIRVTATEPGRSADTHTTTVRRVESEGAFKARAVEVPYNELIKYAPGTLGQAVTYRTKVFQYDFNTGSDAFLGYVTPGSYEFWNDLILFQLPDAALGSGVTKDSYVRVWGLVGRPFSYETRIGTNSVPTVLVKYIEPA